MNLLGYMFSHLYNISPNPTTKKKKENFKTASDFLQEQYRSEQQQLMLTVFVKFDMLTLSEMLFSFYRLNVNRLKLCLNSC